MLITQHLFLLSKRSEIVVSEEDIIKAKNVDIVAVISHFYTIVRKGQLYTTKEHDSMVIYPKTNSFVQHSTIDNSTGKKLGGDVIDFLTKVIGMSWKDSIDFLNDFAALGIEERRYDKIDNDKPIKKGELELPQKEPGAYKRLYAYLLKKRKITQDVINYFVKNDLIYESAEHHNIVFCGVDKDKTIRSICQRGTIDVENKKPFKGGDTNNDKFYGFSYTPSQKSDKLLVVEGPVDVLSYISLTHDWNTHIVALCCVEKNAMVRYLEEHPEIKNVELCFDNDIPGFNAARNLMNLIIDQGKYNVHLSELIPLMPVCYNDLNDYLVNGNVKNINKKVNMGNDKKCK